MKLRINTEVISKKDLLDHLLSTRHEFRNQDPDALSKYADKLTKNAKFLVCRNMVGQRIGLCVYYANNAPMIFISHFWVDGKYRGNGIAGLMMDSLKNLYTTSGFTNISLEVFSDNFSAIHAYEKFGFTIVSQSSCKYQMQYIF